MSSPSPVRGSAVLTVGVAAALLFGVLSAAFASAEQDGGLAVMRAWFRGRASVDVVDPWFITYDRLETDVPRTELLARGIHWRVEPRPETCALIRREGKTEVEVASAKIDDCVIAGASIDGRFVTVGLIERTKAWMLYDDRPRLLRSVPRPVPDGEWLTVDPTRTVGLYRGRIRSTQSEGVATWFWLTDGVGAAMWAGDQALIDSEGSVVPLRALTRPDGALLLSYRLRLPDGSVEERVALFSGRSTVPWKRVDATALTELATIWRLDRWERRGSTWEAIVTYEAADGTRTEARVRTP